MERKERRKEGRKNDLYTNCGTMLFQEAKSNADDVKHRHTALAHPVYVLFSSASKISCGASRNHITIELDSYILEQYITASVTTASKEAWTFLFSLPPLSPPFLYILYINAILL